jgi:hypothetical protein
MHGVIFDELESFVNDEYGDGMWDALVDAANTENDAFLPTQSYPDGDIVTIVKTASEETGESVQNLLFQFGKYTGPELLDMYDAQIDDNWGYFDLLSNTEEQIHKVVRRDMPDSSPPELRTKRVGENEVRIKYASDRRMCSVLEGIAMGMADEYGVNTAITQAQCMLDGASECHISVRAR